MAETIDFEAFAELNRHQMVDTIDAYMVQQGIPDNVRSTLMLLYGGVTAQTIAESEEGFGPGYHMEMGQLILAWLKEFRPDVFMELIEYLKSL